LAARRHTCSGNDSPTAALPNPGELAAGGVAGHFASQPAKGPAQAELRPMHRVVLAKWRYPRSPWWPVGWQVCFTAFA